MSSFNRKKDKTMYFRAPTAVFKIVEQWSRKDMRTFSDQISAMVLEAHHARLGRKGKCNFSDYVN